MKAVIFSLFVSLFLIGGTQANATYSQSGSNIVQQIEVALAEKIDDLKDQARVIRASLSTTRGNQRNRMLREIRVLSYRAYQLQSIKRLVRRLPDYKLVWLAHSLHLNVSTSTPQT